MTSRLLVFATLLCVLGVCCQETVGDANGLAFSKATAAVGAGCTTNGDCLSFNCVASTCKPPTGGKTAIDQGCGSDSDCVSIATCQDSLCVQVCAGEGTTCEEEGACCGSLVCDGACVSPSELGTGGGASCGGFGESCTVDSECCNGTCTPSAYCD